MKCKECNTVDCPFRTTDAEKECQFQTSMIQIPDEWQGVRIQAAIAAMQGLISNEDLFCRIESAVDCEDTYKAVASDAVLAADALVEELKKKQ